MQSSFAVPAPQDSRRRRCGIQYFVVFHDFGEKRAVGVRGKHLTEQPGGSVSHHNHALESQGDATTHRATISRNLRQDLSILS